jgi:alcohol dehydrogenase class IV
MKQEVYFESGSVQCLKKILHRIKARAIFLVTQKASYVSCGAEAILSDLLQGYRVCRFCDFVPNPEITDVEKGIERFNQHPFDVVVAVGGGSALDMAKMVKICAAQDISAREIVKNRKHIVNQGMPLIVIPTTSGSGSEATHFAVCYVGKTKYSVAHEYMLPDVAIIDPDLTASMPPALTAVTGIDAFSQSVESFWSVNSTEQSMADARTAIGLLLKHLYKAVHLSSPESRHAMCKASYLAGRAINISKTTAPHALSYAITSYFGVPHGQAVSLTLGAFLVYNSQVTDEDVADGRGADYVRYTIQGLNELLGCADAAASQNRILNFMRSIGLKTCLSDLGIKRPADHDVIAGRVNLERLANNPRSVTRASIKKVISHLV